MPLVDQISGRLQAAEIEIAVDGGDFRISKFTVEKYRRQREILQLIPERFFDSAATLDDDEPIVIGRKHSGQVGLPLFQCPVVDGKQPGLFRQSIQLLLKQPVEPAGKVRIEKQQPDGLPLRPVPHEISFPRFVEQQSCRDQPIHDQLDGVLARLEFAHHLPDGRDAFIRLHQSDIVPQAAVDFFL